VPEELNFCESLASPRSRAAAHCGQVIVIADRGEGAAPTSFEQVSMDQLNSDCRSTPLRKYELVHIGWNKQKPPDVAAMVALSPSR